MMAFITRVIRMPEEKDAEIEQTFLLALSLEQLYLVTTVFRLSQLVLASGSGECCRPGND